MATKNRQDSPQKPEKSSGDDSFSTRSRPNRREFLKSTAAGLLAGAFALEGCEFPPGGSGGAGGEAAGPFRSSWPSDVERFWLGPEYWTNPLQDWRLSNGRAELIASGPDRNVQLLTHQLGGTDGAFEAVVRLGYPEVSGQGRAGFEVGINGELDDYRFNAVHGSGLRAGITSEGLLFIGDGEEQPVGDVALDDGVELHLHAEPAGEAYQLTLTARGAETDEELAQVSRDDITADRLVGNIAVFGDYEHGDGSAPERGTPRLWFTDLQVTGPKVIGNNDRMFGPVLWAQYTLSRGVMKMTAQMPPVGQDESRTVRLQIQEDGSWETIGEETIDDLARTATFRISDWDDTRDVPYRLVYGLKQGDGQVRDYYYEGTVRKDPVDKEEIVVGALSCQTDFCFPHARVVAGTLHSDPDLLAFTGDQFYESSGGYGVVRDASAPISLSSLDYLRKWYLHGWVFGHLMRDRPTICIPDDHDVFQGNIWAEGGKDIGGYDEHNDGGYYMPAEWIKVVERTQTSHLPDPYDPTPVAQGITVYYTDMNYGRVSFAILEDRKWKSGPDGLIPPHGSDRVDHVVNPDIDPDILDVEGATLLGERQLSFLEEWTTNWSGVDMKAVVSQTAFAQVPNLHGRNWKKLVADLDSNGWPQTPRDEALRKIRKSYAFHIGGDQHLPMILHYGIDDWNDAGYNFSVPAISAGYPRAFHPDEPGRNRRQDMPEYTGEFTTGLGNKVTVWAVANPEMEPRAPMLQRLVDKSSGYGVIRFNKRTREITMEAWPAVDPGEADREQFEGWPMTVTQEENYARNAAAYLPTLTFSGVSDPMIQVIDEAADELVYALRVSGSEFRPKVFREGRYTVKVGDDEEWIETVEGIQSIGRDEEDTLEIQVG